MFLLIEWEQLQLISCTLREKAELCMLFPLTVIYQQLFYISENINHLLFPVCMHILSLNLLFKIVKGCDSTVFTILKADLLLCS